MTIDYRLDLGHLDEKHLLTLHRHGVITDDELLLELTDRGRKYPQLMINANKEAAKPVVDLAAIKRVRSLDNILQGLDSINEFMGDDND